MNSITFQKQVIQPSKVVCVGRNYVEHVKELHNEVPDEPVIFLKPNSAITNEIVSSEAEKIHYEGEMTFLVLEGEIAGVGFGLDLTKREVQTKLKNKGLPWERAKAFDKSAVFSNFVPFIGDFRGLRMELLIDGELVQEGKSEQMIYQPESLLQEIRSFLTLENGDLIMTGTPKGVGELHRGDCFRGRILSGGKLLVERSWIVA